MKPRGTLIGFLGLWTIVAGIIGLGLTGNVWNDWIVGLIVALVGFSMTATAPANGVVAGLLGLWLIASSFIPELRAGSGARFNDFFVGVVMAIAGIMTPRTKVIELDTSKRRAA